jgi:hypothetical protein
MAYSATASTMAMKIVSSVSDRHADEKPMLRDARELRGDEILAAGEPVRTGPQRRTPRAM